MPLSAYAGPGSGFNLARLLSNSTDIVLLSSVDEIGGPVVVLKTWRGRLRPGDKITLPLPEGLTSEEGRAILSNPKSWYLRDGDVPGKNKVTYKRFVAFLKMGRGPKGSYQPAAGRFSNSLFWLENGQGYAEVKMTNPGPFDIVPLYTEMEFFRMLTVGISERIARRP